MKRSIAEYNNVSRYTVSLHLIPQIRVKRPWVNHPNWNARTNAKDKASYSLSKKRNPVLNACTVKWKLNVHRIQPAVQTISATKNILGKGWFATYLLLLLLALFKFQLLIWKIKSCLVTRKRK